MREKCEGSQSGVEVHQLRECGTGRSRLFAAAGIDRRPVKSAKFGLFVEWPSSPFLSIMIWKASLSLAIQPSFYPLLQDRT